jgi:hypothetical protein
MLGVFANGGSNSGERIGEYHHANRCEIFSQDCTVSALHGGKDLAIDDVSVDMTRKKSRRKICVLLFFPFYRFMTVGRIFSSQLSLSTPP